MTAFETHTIESAPPKSRELLEGLVDEVGIIPNLAAAMAESPGLLGSFLSVRAALHHGSFREAEIQVLALTNARENGCRYCTALHSTFALDVGVPAETVEAIRDGRAPGDEKLAALSRFTRKLVVDRGQLAASELEAFLAAGYTKAQALEVLAQLAASIMANYSQHLVHAPVDRVFRAHLWDPDAETTAPSPAAAGSPIVPG